MKKAFDTVSVPILVRSLEDIGIRGTPLALLTDYLSDRKQRVRVGEFISRETNVTYGVPQGSVLGPTFFLIYMNHLCGMLLENGRVFSYADDTAVAFSGDTWEAVHQTAEKGLMEIVNWLNIHLLTLNISKTKYIAFSKYKNNQPGANFTLKIHTGDNITNTNCSCQNIENVSYIKYLGIIVDQRLSWHNHIDMVLARTRKLIWIFKNLRYVTTKKMLTQIYLSLAQSILTYCVPVWGGAIKTKFLELERAHRYLIKVMYCKPYRFPTNELYSILIYFLLP